MADNIPTMRCNALRIVKLHDYIRGEKPSWAEQPVFEYNNKKIKVSNIDNYLPMSTLIMQPLRLYVLPA